MGACFCPRAMEVQSVSFKPVCRAPEMYYSAALLWRTDLNHCGENYRAQDLCEAAHAHLVARHEQGGPHEYPRDGLGGRGVQEHLVRDVAVGRLNDGHVGEVRVVREDRRVQVNDGSVFHG